MIQTARGQSGPSAHRAGLRRRLDLLTGWAYTELTTKELDVVDGSQEARLNGTAIQVALLEGRIDDASTSIRRPAPGCGRDLEEARAFEFVGDTTHANEAWERAVTDPSCQGLALVTAWTRVPENAPARGETARLAEAVAKVREICKTPDPDLL